MLIYEFSDLYPDWATLAKIACVLPVSNVPAERFRLEEETVMWLMRIASCKDTLDAFDKSVAEDTATMKKGRK